MLLRFLKTNWKIILILVIGLFFRLYKYDELFMYGHDQDLAAWVVKDIVIDKHLRLIGQETSTQGIFIGGLFYYLQIPFYLLARMDTIGATFMGALLGLLYIVGIYSIIKRVFSDKAAIIAALIYSISYYFIFNDREIVPTQPVVFWGMALFWALSEIIAGKVKKGLIICAILFALVWHLNFALILPLPLVLVALYLSGKKIKITEVLMATGLFLILSLPLFYFEFRHSFLQSEALVASLSTNQYDIVSGWEKITRTYHLIAKNYFSIFLPDLNHIKYEHVMFLIIILFIYLFYKLKKYRKLFTLLLVWFITYFVFFSLYSKRLSEYYLNGIQFIPIIIFSLILTEALKNKRLKNYFLLVFLILISISINRFITFPMNKNGYVEKKAIISEIKKDAEGHGYPCIAISFITKPGYELGYRYVFWLANMHVNRPDSLSPVYTIVFPLNEKLFPAGKTFGALGLIYPDYPRYTKEGIEKSCSGQNSNLTDPMFGFTK